MHELIFLHKILQKSPLQVHAKSLDRLIKAVGSILTGGFLTLTSIGRHLVGEAKVKNKIKAIDRLIGNADLNRNRIGIYRILCQKIIGKLQKISVIIDWSSCESHENHMLRASIALNGRSMTLYEEVHPEKKLGNYQVHKKFLKQLKNIIPEECKIIVLSDAGFRTEFFQLVIDMGWDFIGRIRSNMLYSSDSGTTWESCLATYSRAKYKPMHLDEVQLSKGNKLNCSLYLYKEKKNKRKNQPKKRKILSGKMTKAYKKEKSEPWLLASSLRGDKFALLVVNQYKRRMKIEHEFRDTKDAQWGIGLGYTRTKGLVRLENLLLIGMLAMFLLWLIGMAAERKKLHYDYQANTVKSHRVLSLVFLGLQIIRHELEKVSLQDLKEALEDIRQNEAIYFY